MSTTTENTTVTVQRVYQLVAQFSLEQQLSIAEHIKKQALAAKWLQFSKAMPDIEPDISNEEIMREIKSVRAERFGK